MKRALISDIHGNYEALTAVLADVNSQNVDRLFCLGDIVGYGPDPIRCLDTVISKCDVTILGNHDQAALFDPDGFNPVALDAIYWTREQLENSGDNPGKIDDRWTFLSELPRRHDEGKFLFVHGSPREATNEYVFPEDIYDSRKMGVLFGKIDQYCFQGHTHMPGVFSTSGDFISPEDCDYEYHLTDDKAMINVGSVGQPRDGNPRSCYAILDEETGIVNFRRVQYDVVSTQHKIYAIPELDNMLGDRLASGR